MRRDRFVVAAALLTITIAAWFYILWLAASMNMGADMAGMTDDAATGGMFAPQLAVWSTEDAIFMFMMWAIMMVGMMVPSVAPMIFLYTRVARQASRDGKPFASAMWFAFGYLAAWAGFSAVATSAQWGLERAALLTPAWSSATPIFGGGLLLVAGIYQWTPLKNACLSQCQAPFVFIQHHGGFRRDPQGSVRLGVLHGLYCVGCCWALMTLLFVGGMMNVLWIAGLAAFVLIEKIVPKGRLFARAAGVLLVALGMMMILESVVLA